MIYIFEYLIMKSNGFGSYKSVLRAESMIKTLYSIVDSVGVVEGSREEREI